MRISSINFAQQGYVKKQVMSQSASARQNKENYNNISQQSFRGNYGAGVGSACGEAAVAWLGGAALAAM